MKIADNRVVVLSYELTAEGKLVDKTEADRPLDYIHGTNMLLPKFEKEIEGMEEGDEFSFVLTPEEGYGEYEPKHKFDIPKDSFEVDGVIRDDLLQIGRVIPLLNSSGMVVRGTVAAIKEDAVTMDFNHPLAGKSLSFKGTVISVREATQKELEEGLHGEYLPHEGCCHGGCHHSDEDGGGECCHNQGDGGCCHGHHEDGECCHGGHHGEGEGHCCHHGEGEHHCCHKGDGE